jgi:hypothetical protein
VSKRGEAPLFNILPPQPSGDIAQAIALQREKEHKVLTKSNIGTIIWTLGNH